MGLTNTPSDLLPGTLELLILKALVAGAQARLRHRRAPAPGVGRRAQVGESALYPALQRLLLNGWVKAEWGTSENNRRARYYTLTAAGRRQLAAERAEFDRMVGAIQRVLRRHDPLPATGHERSAMSSLFRRLRYPPPPLAPRRRSSRGDRDAPRARQDALERDGLAPADAARASRRALGNVTLAVEDARDVWAFARDRQRAAGRRAAVRGLRKSQGFALVAIGTLALGIGANTALFSIFNSLILRPLPVRDPGSLALLTNGIVDLSDLAGDPSARDRAVRRRLRVVRPELRPVAERPAPTPSTARTSAAGSSTCSASQPSRPDDHARRRRRRRAGRPRRRHQPSLLAAALRRRRATSSGASSPCSACRSPSSA